MSHLKTLALRWASPIIPPNAPLPSRVERTVSLPSLKVLEISSDASGCVLALTHLVLPALTSIYVRALSCHPDGSDVPDFLSCVSRHANRHQYIQPLQSMFIHTDGDSISIAAWTLPDIDLSDEVDEFLPDMTTFYTKRSTQMAFTVTGLEWSEWETYTNTIEAILADLPLHNLVTLAVHKYTELDEHFWIRHAPQWPLLQHMQLAPLAAHGFEEILLQENNGRRKSPLLPLLKKLVLVDPALSARRTLHLCDALMNRVEQGAPLETLDLSKCLASRRAVELLSEIVVEVLGPEEALEKKALIISRWDSTARGLFVEDESTGEEYEDNTDSGHDDEGWDDDPAGE